MAGIIGGAGGMQTGNPAAAAASTGQIGAVGAQGNQVTGLLTGPNFGVTPGNALIKNASALQRATAQANIGLGARPGVPGVGAPNAAGGAFGAQNPVALPSAGQFGMTVADGSTAGAAAQPALAQALGAPLGGASASLMGGFGGAQAGMGGGAQAGMGGGAQAGMGGGAQAGMGGGAQAGMAGGAYGAQAGQFGGAQGGQAGGAFGAQAGQFGGAQAGMLDGSSLAASNFAGGAAGGSALQQATGTGVNPITRTNSN